MVGCAAGGGDGGSGRRGGRYSTGVEEGLLCCYSYHKCERDLLGHSHPSTADTVGWTGLVRLSLLVVHFGCVGLAVPRCGIRTSCCRLHDLLALGLRHTKPCRTSILDYVIPDFLPFEPVAPNTDSDKSCCSSYTQSCRRGCRATRHFKHFRRALKTLGKC